MPKTDPFLQVDSLRKSFGGLTAVRDCSFSIQRGGITGLIGPNGAGKSTVFNLIAGAHPPDGGRIILDGQDITGMPAHKLFRLGLVRTFQIPREYGRLTALENLMIPPMGQRGENLLNSWLRWSKVRAQEQAIIARAEEVLDFLGLGTVRDVRAMNLSGGQKKLLELGRAMMVTPKLVLLDEPSAGVNPTLVQTLISKIKQLNQSQGYSFCIVEHDMTVIESLCDPVVVMAAGAVLTRGTIGEVRADPRVLDAYFGATAA
ncbi:MAG: ABC transporter ATP-binding protein [Pseudomonadota bacterium]